MLIKKKFFFCLFLSNRNQNLEQLSMMMSEIERERNRYFEKHSVHKKKIITGKKIVQKKNKQQV